jgi:hypothetical protein
LAGVVGTGMRGDLTSRRVFGWVLESKSVTVPAWLGVGRRERFAFPQPGTVSVCAGQMAGFRSSRVYR